MHGYRNLSLIVCLVLSPCTEAHRPIFSEKKANGHEDAVIIADPGVSQVIYREITGKDPQIWLGFDVESGFELFTQIGIPAIDRLKSFRPCMAVVGPGLPRTSASIQRPKETGVESFATDTVEKPRFFHEHFTGTDSWILRSETVTLPEKGRYFVVAYAPDGSTGKLWLSVGKREVFTAGDIALFPEWRRRIRAFHEVQPDALASGFEQLRALAGLNAPAERSDPVATVISIIESEASVSDFQTAVKGTDLYETLQGPGPFTVFAPTDKALLALEDMNELMKPGNKDRLTAFVEAHVLPERVYLHGLRTTSLSGQQVVINSNGPVLVNDAQVLKANTIAGNGVVHIIDRLIQSHTLDYSSSRQIRRMVEATISHGVPLFNAGQFEACASVYRIALLNIREFYEDATNQPVKKKISDTLNKADEEENPSARAWLMRYALDDIYSKLVPPRETLQKTQSDLLIDDFSDPRRTSTIGTRWRLLTDQVMGGVSDATYEFAKDDRFNHICLKGNVSLENNGGFIQVALDLNADSVWFDARGYRGIRLWVKGNGQRYYVHMRNRQTRLPWQYYSASFATSEKWSKVEIDFDNFRGQNIRTELDLSGLSRVAIVAAKKAFRANICVGFIEFYR